VNARFTGKNIYRS